MTEPRACPLPTRRATIHLAGVVARQLRPGDLIVLKGELGTGKTFFTRALARALGVPHAVPVTSPTFTLVQTYDSPAGSIWHFDLYRLARPEEAYELGIEEALTDGIVLIEWPERLGDLLPAERLDIALAYGDRPTARRT